MKLQANVTIERPSEEVFAFVSDVANMPRWVAGVSSARLISEQVAAGAQFVCEYTSAWRTTQLELQVTTYEPPHSLSIATARGPFSFEARLQMRSVDGGTEVVNVIEDAPDSVSTQVAFMLLGPLLRRGLKKRLERELMSLRRAIVGESPRQDA